MTPLVFVSGILLGTAFSIFFGLSVVALLLFMLGTETPRVAAEIGPLLTYSAVFLVLTVASALGFTAMMKKHPKRWLAQGIMWASWAGMILWLFAKLSD